MPAETIVITRRFRGPAKSGNGGYTAGLLASRTDIGLDPVTVTLRQPPPIDKPLEVRRYAKRGRRFDGDGRASGTVEPRHLDTGVSGGRTRTGDAVEAGPREPVQPAGQWSRPLHAVPADQPNSPITAELVDGLRVVAAALPGTFHGQLVEAVSLETARGAESAYKGLHDHPFPGCFVCGVDREPGDGLRLRPGPIAPGRTACTWRPDPSLADPADPAVVAPEFVWAALDCPGGWTSDIDARPLVLGTMTAACQTRPQIGADYVVVGALIAEEGRRSIAATALYDDQGTLLARAEQIWFAVDPLVFGG